MFTDTLYMDRIIDQSSVAQKVKQDNTQYNKAFKER